ncbi:MAG: cytochrome c oxidase assembly protein [Terracidiphilus sp.]|nr:cytochrome c oxidase assembly protein [Terracidiphilus sp.]
MPDSLDPLMEDWSFPWGLTAILLIVALLYLRGWLALRKTRPDQFNSTRLCAFLGGLASLWIAICSPLEAVADALLSAHMVEHLILMSLVPPLIWMGLPIVPLLRGLPAFLRKGVAGPLLRFRPLRWIGHQLVRPRYAWLAMNLTFLAWHIPAAYDFALENETWHDIEHLCFLSTSMLFWWCIVRPWPASQRERSWGLLLYLVSSDFVNTGLSAFLAFCNRPVYTYYVTHPNALGIQPLPDQMMGAAVMWVFGSMAFLIPAGAITYSLLVPHARPRAQAHLRA